MKRVAALIVTPLLLAGLSWTAAAAESQPTTRVATTGPTTRQVTKITAPLAPGSKEMLTAIVDFTDAPELKDWGIKAGNYALKVYPELDKRLAGEGYTAPREFRLLIKPVKGVAFTAGTTMTYNSDYVKSHLDDLGMVAHELVHVIQHYRGRNPGWLVEGVADYLRYFVIEPGAKNARFNPDRGYKGGYQPAAALLNYIEKKNGPGVVAKLNQVMREGKFKEGTFKEIAGGEPDELWEEFKATLKKPAN